MVTVWLLNVILDQQDHQALLIAKYRPWVAAVSRTQKNTKKPCDLDF